MRSYAYVAPIVFASVMLPSVGSAATGANLPADLFQKLGAIESHQRDQFEKAGEFQKRRCRAVAELLNAPNGTHIGLPIADVQSTYDPDKQRWSFEHYSRAPSPGTLRAGKYYPGSLYLEIAKRETDLPGHVARNAYGTVTQVSVQRREYLVLSVPRRNNIESMLTVTLPMKLSDARAMAGDFRLEVSADLVAPCLYTEAHREDPTFGSPVQLATQVYELHANRKGATWRLIRASTGEVLKMGPL